MTPDIVNQLDEHTESISKTLKSLPLSNPLVYGCWLAQTFYFVQHSTRLLSLAASRCGNQQELFHQRFLSHSVEERKHDLLAKQDIESLGFTMAQFPEFAETQAFYRTQYFTIEHISPLAFFGYILLLEGLAIKKGRELFDMVSKHHGAASCRFLKIHIKEDEDHFGKALEQLSQLPPNTLKEIEANLHYSAQMYHHIIRNLDSILRKKP